MQCDICGKDAPLFRGRIEGTIMNVCKNCSSFGEVLAKPAAQKPLALRPKPVEILERVVPGFGAIIKERREFLGLKQEDFAKKINEKDSLVHKIETGAFTPSIMLARKIGHFLGISLVEDVQEEEGPVGKKASRGESEFTLGDVLKIKK
jgi:uncharacterized protein (TIGR00270 family)